MPLRFLCIAITCLLTVLPRISHADLIWGVSGVSIEVSARSVVIGVGEDYEVISDDAIQDGTIGPISMSRSARAEYFSNGVSNGVGMATESVVASWNSSTSGRIVNTITTHAQVPTFSPLSSNSAISSVHPNAFANDPRFYGPAMVVHTFTTTQDGTYRIDYDISRTLLGSNPNDIPAWSFVVFVDGTTPNWFGSFGQPNPTQDGTGSLSLILSAGHEYQIHYGHDPFFAFGAVNTGNVVRQFSDSGQATFDWQFTAVPEPSSFALQGMVGLFAIFRRKGKLVTA